MTPGMRARNRVGRMRGALVALLGLAWCGATLAADRIRIEIEGFAAELAAKASTPDSIAPTDRFALRIRCVRRTGC